MLKSKKKSVQSALTQHTRQCDLFSSNWAYEKVAAKKKKTYINIYMSRSAHQHTHTLPPQVFPQHPITAGGFRAVPRSGRQRHVATQCRVGDADAVDVVPPEAPGAPHHIAVHAFSRGRTALEGAEGETARHIALLRHAASADIQAVFRQPTSCGGLGAEAA